MPVTAYPTQNIHLPIHHQTIRLANMLSLTGGIITLLATLVILLTWLFSIKPFIEFFGPSVINIPTVIALGVSSTIILFNKNTTLQKWISLYLGPIPLVIGLATLIGIFFPYVDLISSVSTVNIRIGLTFFLLGTAFLITTSSVLRRFYYAQSIVFASLFINLFDFLNSLYISLSLNSTRNETALWSSLLFVILCVAVIFSKPERGFLGLLTADSQSSQLARMSLISFTFFPPLLGLVVLIGEHSGIFLSSARLALIIILIIALAFSITWINIKRLYRTEVEIYLIKEALRVNNITLELNANDLSTKVNQLEQAKKEIIDKFNNQQTLTDLIDTTS